MAYNRYSSVMSRRHWPKHYDSSSSYDYYGYPNSWDYSYRSSSIGNFQGYWQPNDGHFGSHSYGNAYTQTPGNQYFRNRVEDYRRGMSRNRRQSHATYRRFGRGGPKNIPVHRLSGGGSEVGGATRMPGIPQQQHQTQNNQSEHQGTTTSTTAVDKATTSHQLPQPHEASVSAITAGNQIEEILVRCQNLVLRMMLKEKDVIIGQLKNSQDKCTDVAVDTKQIAGVEYQGQSSGVATDRGFSIKILDPPDDPGSQVGRTVASTPSQAATSLPSAAVGRNLDALSLSEICKAQHMEIEALRRVLAEKEWEILRNLEERKAMETEILNLRQHGPPPN